MAVRLGTQDWINPGPFQAAAEMVVDAGRATGAGIAALGAGIGQGLQNRQARQERAQNRQDALDQRGIDNARADRAEARMLKQSKLAASESILAAKKMNLDMASKMYEAMGTPEAEAAMLKAQQDFQEANNWYQVSVGNNAEIEPPQAGVTDYLGVGGGGGVRVGGKPMSQMTDAELNDLMAKSERGEVDYTYRGGATGDMGQGVGNVAPSSQQASMEAAAELVSATDFARAATKKRQQAVDVMATGKTRENRAKADKLKLEAEFLEFEAQRRGQQETAKASAENTRANQAADDERQAARLTADARSAGYKGEPFQTAEAAKAWMTESRQKRLQDDRQEAMEKMKRLGHEQAMVRQDKAKENRIQIEAVAAQNRVDGSPEFKAAKDVSIRLEELAESKRKDFVWASENAKPEVAMQARVAYERALAESETQIRRMASLATQPTAPKTAAPAPAPAAGGAPAAPASGTYPSWMPNDPEKRARWDALPDVEKQKVIKVKGQ